MIGHRFFKNVCAAVAGKWADESMRLSEIIKVPPYKKESRHPMETADLRGKIIKAVIRSP
jgi:hypothetical protein